MRAVAADAEVVLPTVELVFGTKAKLLKAVIDVAIAGDDEPVPMLDGKLCRRSPRPGLQVFGRLLRWAAPRAPPARGRVSRRWPGSCQGAPVLLRWPRSSWPSGGETRPGPPTAAMGGPSCLVLVFGQHAAAVTAWAQPDYSPSSLHPLTGRPAAVLVPSRIFADATPRAPLSVPGRTPTAPADPGALATSIQPELWVVPPPRWLRSTRPPSVPSCCTPWAGRGHRSSSPSGCRACPTGQTGWGTVEGGRRRHRRHPACCLSPPRGPCSTVSRQAGRRPAGLGRAHRLWSARAVRALGGLPPGPPGRPDDDPGVPQARSPRSPSRASRSAPPAESGAATPSMADDRSATHIGGSRVTTVTNSPSRTATPCSRAPWPRTQC